MSPWKPSASGRPASTAEVTALVEAMAQTLQQAEAQAATSDSAVLSSAAEVLGADAAAALAPLAEMVAGLEAEYVCFATLAAAIGVAVAGPWRAQDAGDEEPMAALVEAEAEENMCKAWLAVCMQHPYAVRERHFLGVRFSRQDVERRWPRFVQTLGISEEQALAIIETDATPLLVEPDDIAEVLSRLAAISSREKALELVGWNPALLLGGIPALKEGKDFGVSALVDILYAGRLSRVLEEAGRDTTEKLREIEWYSYAVTGLKPLLDIVQKGGLNATTDRLCRKPLEIAARVLPNSALRVFLKRVLAAPDPFGFLVDQTKAGLLMTSSLAMRPWMAGSIIPHSPSILPHLPAIYTRLSILRPHIPGIVRILDPYFEVVEPHLDRIMERMDKIEPHLPYILIHLDVLAKHCGPLLDHFDELMPYASSKAEIHRSFDSLMICYEEQRKGSPQLDAEAVEACVLENWDEERPEHEIERATQDSYYLPRLLPYVDFLVPRLDTLAPHLPLVHPHLPHILPYLDSLLPYIPLFEAHPKASANADVLIGYLGWILRVPYLPRIMYLPLVPRIIAELSTVLPRRLIRPALERRRRRREEAERAAVQASVAEAHAEAASKGIRMGKVFAALGRKQ